MGACCCEERPKDLFPNRPKKKPKVTSEHTDQTDEGPQKQKRDSEVQAEVFELFVGPNQNLKTNASSLITHDPNRGSLTTFIETPE